VNLSAKLLTLEPTGLVTVISTVPAAPAGDTAVIDESPLAVKDAAGVEPKSTALVPRELTTVTSTVAPVVPVGETAVIDVLLTTI
jgi:hypothetical protein